MSGPFGSSQWMYASGGFYPYEIDQSVRFNGGDSPYLSRTPSSAGNKKTWTWSSWIKRSSLQSASPYGGFGIIFAGGNEQNMWAIPANCTLIAYWINSEQLAVIGTGNTTLRLTTARQRDLSGWYHFVVAMDTTQASANDRTKIYINGVQQTSFDTTNNVAQNTDLNINEASNHFIGGQQTFNAAAYMNMYLAETHFIDGQALTASSFGETKAGIWIPKEYTGSYGTNGFKLAFQDSASLGDDTSGNGNDFTANNLAATDQMLDTPTSNFPTMNKLWQSKGTWTTAEGNLQNTWSANDYQSGIATMGLPATGKWYWEIYLKSRTYTNWLYWNLVIADYAEGSGNNGNSASQWSDHYFSMSAERSDTGYLAVSSGSTNSIASSGIYDTGNVIQVAFDADNKRLYLGDSGTWFLSADPGAESGDGTAVWYNWSDDAQGKLFPAVNVNYFTYVDVHNFGQDSTFAGNLASGGNADANGIGDFKYSVPSGYLALCAANLPAPGIDPAEDEAPEDYFNTLLYSGTGAENAVTGVGFAPDFVWFKDRGNVTNHLLFDVVRGATKTLRSDVTDVESTNAQKLKSFDSDGFTLGTDNNPNGSSRSFVAWNWKAGGTAVSNTDGTITSSVSASPESGFSIVSYTTTANSSDTVGHGLSSAPELIFTKDRDNAINWFVFTTAIDGSVDTLKLDLTDAAVDQAGSPAITATTFTTNYAVARNTIAYCFHSVEGYSKIGSYTGNSSTTFVYTGFRPAFVMIKSSNQTRNWIVFDNKRTPTNQMDGHLHPNASVAEQTGSDEIDFLSNGFNLRSPDNDTNTSAFEYVYLAFAEQPFKYANAR